MSKSLKRMLSEHLRQRYVGVDSACVVDFTGLDVQQTQALRRDLCSKGMSMQVVKNSMARMAFADGPLEPLARTLSGPCALVTGGDSIMDVGKALAHWTRELPKLTLKEAIIEGDSDLVEVLVLSKMRTRLELVADIAMLAASPGRALAGCLSAPQSRIAGCLKTLAEQDN